MIISKQGSIYECRGREFDSVKCNKALHEQDAKLGFAAVLPSLRNIINPLPIGQHFLTPAN